MKKHLDFRTLVSRLIVTVVMCLPAWGSSMLAQEAESYAVFDAESATLTFRHDAAKPGGGLCLERRFGSHPMVIPSFFHYQEGSV